MTHSPGETGAQGGAVVEPAAQHVEEVGRAREVQAQLGPLHYVPQGQRAETKKK